LGKKQKLSSTSSPGSQVTSSIYAVSGYPTKVVIDPQGKIVKFVTGESEEFYEFLDSLFKK
jgi:hypothetical protein